MRMNKFDQSKSFQLCTLFFLVLCVSACAKSNRKSTDEKSTTSSQTDQADQAQSEDLSNSGKLVVEEEVCANPVGLDDVPADWSLVEGKELITGEKGQYELTQVQVHTLIQVDKKTVASATTDTLILKNGSAIQPLVQNISCLKLGNMDKLSFSFAPADSFSTEDGSYSVRRNVKFLLMKNKVEKSASTYSVKDIAKFGERTEATKQQEEKARSLGISFESKMYKISAEEFEIRSTVTMPDQNGNADSREFIFNSAYRYKLQEKLKR